MQRSVRLTAILPFLALAGVTATGSVAAGLDDDLGRNEVRIYSGRYEITPGRTVMQLDLPGRLDRLGYVRRRGERPRAPGEYFFGFERFWIYRREIWIGGKRQPARLWGLVLRRSDGAIQAGIDEREEPLGSKHLWLEPELLAESFDANRAPRQMVRFRELSEHTWRAVLAAEDARFFEHVGMDARALARAMLRNAKAGRVVQGGSTITQQLVKVRDLSPKRSLGRKASEAIRALALEAEYDKTEILEAYLNAIYFGHLDGVQIYGLGTAARVYFSKPANQLSLAESALLAAMIQGPNRLHPVRNPDQALTRYRWVLSRLQELGWASDQEVETLQRRLPALQVSSPPLPMAAHFLNWLQDEADTKAPKRSEEGRGVVVHSTLDPLLQELAEESIGKGLNHLRSRHPRLRANRLSAALVALDGRNGDVLAYVGGDPTRRSDRFDRARLGRRQPGSTVKPLVLLEAFQECGEHEALYPARRVSDRPLTLDLPSGPWRPDNPDGRFRDSVSVRQATVASLNVPFVRIARRCGYANTADRLRSSGMTLPSELPPSFVLGAVETTPLALARAYTVFSSLGRARRPRPYRQIFRPSGRLLAQRRPSANKVVSAASAYMIRDLMEDSVRHGTAAAGALDNAEAFGKTGTSSEARDAWFAGGAGSVLVSLWVGLDNGGKLGLSGAAAAAPIWKAFMERAVPLRPDLQLERPRQVVDRWIQVQTGLLVSRQRSGSELDLFRRGATPPKRRLFRKEKPIPVIQ